MSDLDLFWPMKAFHIFLVSVGILATSHAFAEPRPQELVALDRYVGNWDDTSDASGKIDTKCEWILDGSFLRHSWSIDSGRGETKTIGMQLMSYDAVNRTYRAWTFFTDGRAQQGEGTWDASSKTFTWTFRDASNGLTAVTKVTFVSDDQEDVAFTATDGDGKVVTEYRRKKVRRK